MIRLFLIISTVLFLQPAAAEISRGASYSPTISADRFEQRRQYRDAIHLIRASQFTRYHKLKPSLRTYALYPYLEYTEMAYRISRQTEHDILAFVEQNADTPLTVPLMQHWLANLAKRQQWELFIRHYPDVEPTKELACSYGYALHKAGLTEQAMVQAEKLWLVGHSQPDSCDAIFAIWRNHDGMTSEFAWQRLALSLKENNKKLSSYLQRFVSKQDKPFASNYRLVATKPKTIKRTQAFRRGHIRNREIILFGVVKLARNNPEDALRTLQQYQSMHNFDPESLENAYANIGVRLTQKGKDPALLDDLPVNLHEHSKLVEARLRQNLALQNWREVIVLINLLPAETQASARWQYWKARVLAQSADQADRDSALAIFTELSGTRTFYGFISADILQQHYNFEDEPREITLEQIFSLEETPGIQRALELFALGERARARREWYFTTRDFSSPEREIAARVALRWAWYKAAIQSMIEAGAWNHLDYRFPLAYPDTFITHARQANIPVQWSLAIARQESAFMPDAKSKSGALGLMQLMPSTAKSVAKKIGVSYANNTSLTEPNLNVRLGTHYLGQMLRRFDNNRILASAAYNAGPGRVDKWKNPDVPFDVWIEIIPFTETRNYVQNVLMFSSIYSLKMNESQPLIYAHERDYFSAQQISTLQTRPNADASE